MTQDSFPPVMESDGTHGDSSEADSSLKVASQQQTSWIVVLYRECGVPAGVLAQVFSVSPNTVRRIANGTRRSKTVRAINSEYCDQLRELSLDMRLGKLLSDSFLTRKVLEEVQRECLSQVEAFKARVSAEKDRMQETATAITAVLTSAANPVAQTAGVLTD